MTRPCAIYYLIDPDTHAVRYVGISIDPVRRYSAHLDSYKYPQRHSACWIRGLALRGARPELRIVAWVQSKEEAKRLEILLIARFTGLTNISSGGEGGSDVRWSAERKAAHGARVRERFKDPEARARQSEATRLGWRNKPESRARISAASRGRVQSAETRAKKSAALMGHAVSAESISKLRLANLGRKHTTETKAKMSASHIGHGMSLETRAKIGESNRGRAISAGHRAKTSAALKNRNSICVGEM